MGIATVVINNNPIEIPFSFLDDFSLELIESTDMLDCPATKGAATNATNTADSTPTTQLIPPVEVTVQEVTRLIEVTRVQQPTVTPTFLRATRTAVPPSATAYFPPKVTFSRPTEQNWDDIVTLWQKVSYQDPKSPGVETYNLTIHSSDVYRWSFAWCALNSTRLNDILQPLTVSFLVDGRALPDNDLLQHDLTASAGSAATGQQFLVQDKAVKRLSWRFTMSCPEVSTTGRPPILPVATTKSFELGFVKSLE